MKRKQSAVLILVLLACTAMPVGAASFFVDVEGGAVGSSYNDIRIPGDTGTMFSLTDGLESKVEPFFRLRVGMTLGRRHTLSLLYAPLTVKSSGTLPYILQYFGVTFPQDTPLDATYKFNSYRISWRYELVDREKIRFGIGLSFKIRDAAIKVTDGTDTAEKTNVGFVPLINFRLEYLVSSKWSLLLEGDALAAPQGRAEDVLVAVVFKPVPSLAVRLGYRFLEGGADNDEVYTFSMFHYLSAGATWTF